MSDIARQSIIRKVNSLKNSLALLRKKWIKIMVKSPIKDMPHETQTIMLISCHSNEFSTTILLSL